MEEIMKTFESESRLKATLVALNKTELWAILESLPESQEELSTKLRGALNRLLRIQG